MKVALYTNLSEKTLETKKHITERLKERGITIQPRPDEDTDFIIVIGGDGSLLRMIHNMNFPKIPIIGINTGHFGWFMEINADQIDKVIDRILSKQYALKTNYLAKMVIKTDEGEASYMALNEFAVKSDSSRPLHVNISIDDKQLEEFTGDGVILSTPAGGTAYSYSIGGAIVDPNLRLLQMTPMAPIRSGAYKTMTSPIVISGESDVIIRPVNKFSRTLRIVFDGEDIKPEGINEIRISLTHKRINLVQLDDKTFWDLLREKFVEE